MNKNRLMMKFFGLLRMQRMNLKSILFLCVIFMELSHARATTYAQKERVTLELNEPTIEEVFEAISKQTNYEFFYNNTQLNLKQKVDVNVEDETVKKVLDKLLEGTNCEYQLYEKQIVITDRKPQQQKLQKSVNIRGKVTDKSGQPIPGATVIIEGSYIGTATNNNGMFNLKSPKPIGVLTISFVGFETKKFKFSGDQTLTIKMIESSSDLDEVQVIAYGESNKREMSGVVSVVKADDIKGIPSPSLSNLLQGRVAGMDVTNISGAPGGGGTQITIRGYNSLGIEAGRRFSNPLWVVDGVPMTSFTSPVTGTNGLSDINPEMIESIHVLKDASATSLYGSRAANGVILVTTKRGKKNQKGKFSINFSQTYSILPEFPLVYGGKGERDFRLQSRRNYKEADYDFDTNSYKYPTSYKDVIGTYGTYDFYWRNGESGYLSDGDKLQDSLNTFFNNSTNFYKKLYNTGKVTNANIQTYGGGEKMSYSIGLGYYDEKGIVIGTGFNRVNLMGNFVLNPVENLTVNFNNYLSMSDRSRGVRGSGLSTGEQIELIPGDASELSTLLPLRTKSTVEAIEKFKSQEEKNVTYRLRTSFMLEYNFSKNLSFSNTTSIDYSQNNRNSFSPAALDPFGETSTSGEIERNKMFLNESLLNYSKSINDQHNVKLMMGLSFQRDEYDYIGGAAKNGPSDHIHYAGEAWPDLKERSEFWIEALKNYRSDYSEKKMNSYFGRLNYDYDKKYFFTATIRRDGSSVFGDNMRWATFPSFAASWNFTEENFIDWPAFLDFGKIRASYGLSGNTFKNPYLSYGLLNGKGPYGGNPTIKPERFAGYYNPNLSWEETRQFDFGIDLNLLNYKLSITADYYNRYTDKMLYQTPMEGDYSGYEQMWRNAAAISNEGIELEVKYDILRNENTYWRVSINAAKNWNRFADSYNGKDFYDENQGKYYILGKKLNGIVGLKTDGYWQTDTKNTAYFDNYGSINYLNPYDPVVYYYPGNVKFKDVNGDNVISEDDMVYLGSSLPDITGGIVNEVRWKNFDLNVLLSFSLGRDIINAQPINSLGSTKDLSPIFVNLNKASFWQKSGDKTDYPIAHYSNANFDWNAFQDRYVESVNYLKVKTLTLGYRMPKSLPIVNKFEEVRLFFSGENLLTWTNYSGIDPETVNMTTGTDDGKSYPLARKLTLGITLKL